MHKLSTVSLPCGDTLYPGDLVKLDNSFRPFRATPIDEEKNIYKVFAIWEGEEYTLAFTEKGINEPGYCYSASGDVLHRIISVFKNSKSRTIDFNEVM